MVDQKLSPRTSENGQRRRQSATRTFGVDRRRVRLRKEPQLLALTVGLAMVLLPVVLSAQCLSFPIAGFHSAGDQPHDVVAGDFDEDGVPDLAVANREDNTISIMLGDGAGGFGPASTVTSPSGPVALASADVNNDGHLDLACVAQYADRLAVLLGDGMGAFAGANFQTGAGPVDLAMGDFNLDGNLDIATVNESDNSVTVFVGNGLGSMAAIASLGTGASPQTLVIADFNLDGFSDIAVSEDSEIFLGDGLGGFPSSVSLSWSDDPVSTVTADFNGDGMPDLVMADRGAGGAGNTEHVSVRLWTGVNIFGEPEFTTPAEYSIADDHISAEGLVARDYDQDGDLDLAVLSGTGLDGEVAVLYNDGNGVFLVSPRRVAVGLLPKALIAEDLDGNGALDLVVACSMSDSVNVVLARPGGDFVAPQSYTLLDDPTAVVARDVDGDGRVELVIGHEEQSLPPLQTLQTRVWNDTTGVFGPGLSSSVTDSVLAIESGDLNGDGDLDLVLCLDANGSVVAGGTVQPMLGSGTNTFFAPNSGYYLGTHEPVSVGLIEFSGDAHVDVVFSQSAGQNAGLLLGDGLGGLSYQAQGGTATGLGGTNMATGDFNEDGRVDYIVASWANTEVRLGIQNPSGSFVLWNTFPVGGFVVQFVVDDFNGDGHLDIAAGNVSTVNPTDTRISVFLGDGLGGMGAPAHYPTTLGPFVMALGDLNGDTYQDLVVASIDENTASVLIGDGLGGFSEVASYFVGWRAVSLACGDFDGSGYDDLAVAGGDGRLTVFLNQLSSDDCNQNLIPDACDIAGGTSLDENLDGVPDECTGGSDFTRGDCNVDGSLNIADAIYILGYLFPIGGVPNVPDCESACDANDDGGVNLADTITALSALFGNPVVVLPVPMMCGPDPTVDFLHCDSFAVCP